MKGMKSYIKALTMRAVFSKGGYVNNYKILFNTDSGDFHLKHKIPGIKQCFAGFFTKHCFGAEGKRGYRILLQLQIGPGQGNQSNRHRSALEDGKHNDAPCVKVPDQASNEEDYGYPVR